MRYAFADCELDTQLRVVHRGDTQHTLRPKPFQVLLYLLEHRDRVASKQELAEQLWPDQYVSDAVIENGILAARRAVGDSGREQRIIRTFHGHGYRFVASVSVVGEEMDNDAGMGNRTEIEARPAQAEHSYPSVEEVTAPQVRSTSASSPTPGESTRRQLTILFCDLVGSTALSSQVDPEDYLDIIRAYHDACRGVIERFEGHIAQYLGDGLLVYFGYPQAHEDDAQRAVHAALGILDTLEQLNDRLQAAHGVQVAVRMGIHTGLVVVSAMGTGSHSAPLAVGETPNVAARLQDLAVPDTVVISEATYRLVYGYFECQALGAQSLKGLAEPLATYQVLRTSEVHSRFAARSTHTLMPLVGRERELELLLERWTQTRQGSGHVIFISGEAGIGKSRLVHALKDQISSDVHTYLECQGSPYHQRTAFWPLTELLPRLFEWKPDEPTATKLAKMIRVLEQVQLPVEETAPLLASLLALDLPEESWPPLALTSERQRQNTFAMLLTLVSGLAIQHPVLLSVEDLHWIDPSTLEFLEQLIDQVPMTALCVVVTCRPTVQPSWLIRTHVVHVTLDRLRPELVEEMIGLMAGKIELPATVLQQIVASSDGVPLFVEEVTKMILEAGGQSTLTIPTTLHDLLVARLDHLITAKGLAQLAATIGREFSYTLLQMLTPLDEPALQHELSRLVQAELLYQRGIPPRATYLFKHALIQDAAYQTLLKSTRQQYHQRIAQVLAGHFLETTATQPELIAHHALQGELWDMALAYYQQAGTKALSRSAYQEAVTCFERALDALQYLPERRDTLEQAIDLRWDLRQALVPLSAFERGFALLCEAETLAEKLGDQQRLGRVVANMAQYFHTRERNYDRALDCCQRALALAVSSGDTSLQVTVQRYLGISYYQLGDYRRARDVLRQATASLRGEERYERYPILPSVHARSWLVRSLTELGAFAEGYRYAEEAVRIAKGVDHLGSLIWAQLNLGWVILWKGNFDQAIPVLECALSHCHAANIALWVPGISSSLGYAHALSGRVDTGLPLLA